MTRTSRRIRLESLANALQMLAVYERNGMGDWPVAVRLRARIVKLTGKGRK